MMSIAEEKGIITGFEASRDGSSISYLHFANDTICFVDADME